MNQINIYGIICGNDYNTAEEIVIRNFISDEDNMPQIIELTADHNRVFRGIYVGTAKGANDGDTPIHISLFVATNGCLQIGFGHNLETVDLVREVRTNISREARLLLKKMVALSN